MITSKDGRIEEETARPCAGSRMHYNCRELTMPPCSRQIGPAVVCRLWTAFVGEVSADEQLHNAEAALHRLRLDVEHRHYEERTDGEAT